MNNFTNGSEAYKYFLDIAPDFSIFDLAEKDIIENGDSHNPLFFMDENTGSAAKSIKTTFRRAMFKCNTNLSEINSNCSYVNLSLSGFQIFICISNSENIEFNLDADTGMKAKVIGVCF